MADSFDVSFAQFTFTLREAQFARPDELGQWRGAKCMHCAERIPIHPDERASTFLHRIYGHECGAPN
ncbi:hypothetical protein GC722_05475 [Auraticoccus sp. F435]|uniref:Uncharacterized protein n=1 Tax=Auraticoccus cholistanensis TaxID=2656650 RepID=A0A6A9US07_9ACTN|nr:hypothetical protein [Auraticoccus cholistanensis]MVA75481.1 hypothetical protein [Auraticoccus cholistanensis]